LETNDFLFTWTPGKWQRAWKLMKDFIFSRFTTSWDELLSV
jgi:hypothetical protein